MKIEDIAADWCIRLPAKRRQIAQYEDTFAKAVKHGAASEQLQESL
eukprot:gene21301-6180_t